MPPRRKRLHFPVLIVDDNVYVRRTLREILIHYGVANVALAGDGGEALERCREIVPAVILLDWTMPFLDGKEFLKLLRSDPDAPGRHASVTVVTATPTRALVQEARQWDVDAVVRKPFSPETIMKRIELGLMKRAERMRKAREIIAPPPVGDDRAVFEI
jgi:two-component system chemotaxis response regulator CheY